MGTLGTESKSGWTLVNARGTLSKIAVYTHNAALWTKSKEARHGRH